MKLNNLFQRPDLLIFVNDDQNYSKITPVRTMSTNNMEI
jgi:hypothetical protein